MKKQKPSLAEIEGVNRTLLEWALNSKLLKSVLKTEIEEETFLYDIFGKETEEREKASLMLYQSIWAKYPEFGPNLLLELLAKFEHDRVFYSNYRDHTTHMVKSFLLGVYFYENCSVFRERVTDSDTFIKIWVLTSLYHDIGYVLENDEIKSKSDQWFAIKNTLNEMLCAPLSNVIYFQKGISKARERKIIGKYRIYTDSVQESSEFDDEALFEPLREYGHLSALSANGDVNGLYKYYCYACSYDTNEGRKSFRDHGISGAVIFVRLWSQYNQYIESLCEKQAILDEFEQNVQKEIIAIHANKELNEKMANISVGAIALHNVNKEIWDKNSALAYQLDLENFKISYKDEKLFYAFLLRLCDEIQMWDRPRFRKPEMTDKNLYSADMDIYAKDNKIFIAFREDDDKYLHPEKLKESSFGKLIRGLGQCLDEQELSDLLLYKGMEDINKMKKGQIKKAPTIEVVHEIQNVKEKTIDELKPWVVGAVNIDEDVHFSSYYLKQSMQKYLPSEFKDVGYKNIITVYEDFNETYYIPLSECEEVSNNLIKKSLADPMFMERIIEKITKLIFELKDVFDFEPSKDIFAKMTDSKILDYYKKHDEVHTKLYVYARIPEALDRGVSTFTNYLKRYLKEKNPELHDEKRLNEVFGSLTYPENISLSGIEVLELYQLILEIRKNDINTENRKDSGRNRTLIKMSYDTYSKVENFANKWAFWGYHGYGHRVIRDFNYFVDRLKIEIDNPSIKEQRDRIVNAMDKAAAERIINFSQFNVDEQHQLLFRVFSKIGTIKILRRYYQLRNFYYLDNLIFEIAKRNRVSEAVIRCLLPEEVVSLLKGDIKILEKGEERLKSEVFAFTLREGNAPQFIIGKQAKQLYGKMKKLTAVKTLQKGQIKGDTASLGHYKGTCRTISRNEDTIFEKGDILVCVDTDPDMFDKLKIAGAVLTESGGLTCHAAIVCRELKIPCIVRIEGLMNCVKDGDILDVNADNGTVTISTSISKNIAKSIHAKEHCVDEKSIGKKASALLKMKANNILVPEFFCIPYKVLRKVFYNIDLDNMGQESQALMLEIKTAIEELGGPLFAIRSSTLNEDLENFSGAGQEITELRVSKDNVINTLIRLISECENSSMEGSIIVQKMILGDLSGVMFTQNPLCENGGILIETVPGGNEYLTSGKISPVTYTWNHSQKMFIEKSGDIWSGLLDGRKLEMLQKEALRLEKLFNSPQDVEWTILREKLYILQSRKITGKEQVDSALIFSQKNKKSRNIMSIYQVYALPINLQQHMLRVAAVAKWILDRWKGESLNDREIVETLLLHDIGNLVKVTEDKFESLFPDTYVMESFQYWRNIRNSIITRYGKTDTEATYNIVKEIKVSDTVMNMIEKKQFVNNADTYHSHDYAIKICAYADQRVSPNGVLSLENRLNEAVVRYRGVEGASINSANRDELVEYAKEIEKQIFEYVDGQPEDITDVSIESYIDELKKFSFS